MIRSLSSDCVMVRSRMAKSRGFGVKRTPALPLCPCISFLWIRPLTSSLVWKNGQTHSCSPGSKEEIDELVSVKGLFI